MISSPFLDVWMGTTKARSKFLDLEFEEIDSTLKVEVFLF